MISFFELGVADTDKGRAFYEGLFGWSFETGPSGTGWMLGTGGTRGGRPPTARGAPPYFFSAVDDRDAARERVRARGGERLPFDRGGAPRHGRFEFCKDDQGSPFGLHQPPR